jgi:hypothetical protein
LRAASLFLLQLAGDQLVGLVGRDHLQQMLAQRLQGLGVVLGGAPQQMRLATSPWSATSSGNATRVCSWPSSATACHPSLVEQ